jgi:hypothetical protein
MVFIYGLLLKIVIIESQSLLTTQRTFNNTFIAVFFTLLGSVFGLMQIIGSVMSLVENTSESFKLKIEKFVRLEKVKRQRKDLNKNFSQKAKKILTQKATSKILPFQTENQTIPYL